MKKTFRLRPWILQISIWLSVLIILCTINTILEKDMEQHIQIISQKCASQGYGITHYYTNQGDKFYKCDVGGQNEK